MASQTEIKKTPTLQKASYIFLLVAIASIFIPAGAMKFMENEQIIANFSKWDLLKWKEIIGIIEILSVLLLLIPRTNLIGVVSLSIIMIGAIITHVTHSEPYFFNLAIILVLWIIYLFVKPKKQIQK